MESKFTFQSSREHIKKFRIQLASLLFLFLIIHLSCISIFYFSNLRTRTCPAGVTDGVRVRLQAEPKMSANNRLNQVEMLLAGLFQTTGVIIDRLVENGVVERLEIDAALQAVEDRAFSEMDAELNRANPARQALARSARTLRIINARATSGAVLSVKELRALLRFERDV